MAGWAYAGSPINWCNDDLLDLGDHYSVHDILKDMQALGLRGCEMGRKFPRDAEQLRLLLQQYDLQLASGWAQVHLADPALWPEELDRYRTHVRFLRAMGCSVVVTAEGSGSVHWDRSGDHETKVPWSDAEWRSVCQGLEQAGQICRDEGLRLVYHPHLGTNIEEWADIVRLLAGTSADLVSLVLDTGHLAVAGVDPVSLMTRFPDRIGHVHLKSFRRSVAEDYRGGLGFLACVREGIFTVPGDGEVDFAPILERLRRIGYAGWCVIETEQDPSVVEPVQAMRQALNYLSRHDDNPGRS